MTSEASEPVRINIEDEMRQSYMDYAMSVIVGRALPDIRDGLKPVQRRILYAMLSEGLVSTKKTSKCAGVVGEVLKRFHPHGDSAVYDALVRLAQPWVLRYPLVDGQGNFGSIDGDPAAAYRYTECRLTAVAEQLLEDIEKDTVDFIPNFDDSTMEPVVLPAVLPNLLLNGADGIAVGMATHIPPHNLTELANGLVALIENPELTLSELMEHIPGPDFPTGGLITNRAAILKAYASGREVLQIRAKTSFEMLKQKSREVEAIVITEIPFQVNKGSLLVRIAELVNEKQIEGISRLRDESDRKGMRIVIELKRDATRDVVLNQLFKLTPLQTSFGVINLAIVDGQPVICPLVDMLRHFLSHRRDVITRRTQFDLRKAEERMHILEGFRIALLNLDEVIQLIKGSETPAQARDGLMKKYKLSELQAQAILDLRLQKLTGMERLAIEKEHSDLAEEIKQLKAILADVRKVDALIKGDLLTLRDRFGDKRRTEIIDGEPLAISVEDMIEDQEMVVSISHAGYVKRTAINEYRSQRRGGKGVAGGAQKDEDFVEHLFIASTLSYVLVFTTLGRLHWLKVYNIPEAGRTARGRALINLLSLKSEEGITAILSIKDFVENRYVVMSTRKGIIKKVDLMEFSRPRKAGINACSLDDGDGLIGVALTGGTDHILLSTKEGLSIRFNEEDVRPMGRAARGVIGIRLDETDAVVGMAPVLSGQPSEGLTLLTVCENGFGKRTKLDDYRPQGRGGRGIIDIQTDSRNGPVVGVCVVNDTSELMLITSSTKIIRFKAGDLSVIGRNTKGVRLIDLDEGEKVVAIAPLVEGTADSEQVIN